MISVLDLVFSSICLITFAGIPAATEYGGTSFVTIAPAATTEP